MRLTDQHVKGLLVAGANKQLRERSWLLDALTLSSDYTNEIVVTDKRVAIGTTVTLESLKFPTINTPGAVVRVNKKHLGIVSKIERDVIDLEILTDGSQPCYGLLDVFDVPAQTVKGYLGHHPFTAEKWGDTTVGRYLCNIVMLQYPFDSNIFKYINDQMDPDAIIRLVKDELLAKRITVTEYEKFIDYMYFLGHMSELSTPSMTVRSLETNPKVPEIKKKFIEEHKDHMTDPMVIKQLEDALIKADREYLGDDPSVTFFDGLGKSTYTLKRKKLFLTVGGIPAFGSEGGGMDFVQNSLMEGWTKEAMPSIVNEIRKGSYERGVETAKGGAETKLVLRVFQDTVISEDDCGTKRTVKVDCGRFKSKDFIGRTINVGNNDVIITEENLDKYVTGKVIRLYSPLTCETKHNYCFKCCGAKAKDLGARQLGFQTIKITSKFMTIAMKNMHGTTLSVRQNKLEDILL